MSASSPSPAAAELALTHFVVADDVPATARFYSEILGGTIVREIPGGPTIIQLANGWIIINNGGGPTPDKPTVTLEQPQDLERVSAFLNIRVGDIQAIYREWTDVSRDYRIGGPRPARTERARIKAAGRLRLVHGTESALHRPHGRARRELLERVLPKPLRETQ